MGDQIIIGFAGKAGSGKDSAAQALARSFAFSVVHFADPLKRAAAAIFGFSDAQMNTPEGKANLDFYWGLTPRTALQRLGTESVRDVFGEDFWVRRLFRDLSQPRVAIPDVRFPEEANAIRAAGGRVILITRPGAGLAGTEAAHPSENALDGWPFDLEIENDAGVAELRACAVETARDFFPELRT